MTYQTHSGGVYQIYYHLVFCPKYRRKVLVGNIPQRLNELIRLKVIELGGEVKALEIQPDHVHLFIAFPPKWSPAQIAFRIKGYASHVLRQEFPHLKSRLPSLWSRSCYIGTAGSISAETIRKYIEAQKRSR